MFIQETYNNPEIIIVGAGGIGSNLIYNINRDKAFYTKQVSRFLLYDGDKVEPKNLIRQNFTSDDIGRNKATALAERYRQLNIEAVESYFDPNAQIGEDIGVFDLITSSDILITGVDNITTRIDIIDKMLEMFSNGQDLPLWIDAGNETHHGNVLVLGDYDILTNYRDILIDRLEEDDAPYNKSCADIEEEDDGFIQIYDVNMLAALYISIVMKKIMTQNAKEFYQLTKGVAFSEMHTTFFNMEQQLELLQREEINV